MSEMKMLHKNKLSPQIASIKMLRK